MGVSLFGLFDDPEAREPLGRPEFALGYGDHARRVTRRNTVESSFTREA
jgi:hypothetical protein